MSEDLRMPIMSLPTLLLAAALGAAQTNPFASDPNAVEAGRGTFRIYCSPCHGIKGKGGRAPDLTTGVYSAGETDADLHKVISDGVPGTEMPDFAGRLEPETIWKLVAYVRSVGERRATPVAGNSAAGEKVFWEKGRCGQCHQVATRGGRLGPELTRIGRTRSLAYLLESIVAPNADVTSGYATIRVTTRDGKEIVGVQKGIDNFSAQLMDLGENFHSFYRSSVASIRREFRSLMPADYKQRLTQAEIDDLVAYLVTLRGSEKKP